MKKSHLQKYIFKQKVYFTLRLCGKSTKMTKRETYAQGKRKVFLGSDKCRIAVKDVLEEPMKLYLQYVCRYICILLMVSASIHYQ